MAQAQPPMKRWLLRVVIPVVLCWLFIPVPTATVCSAGCSHTQRLALVFGIALIPLVAVFVYTVSWSWRDRDDDD